MKNTLFIDIEGLFIPKNVKLIGEKSFAESGIETLTIEDGCEAVIENDAFCASIKYGIKIPKSITQIGDHVFTFSPSSINTCKFYFEEDSAALDYYNKYVKTMAYEIITPNSKKINQAMLVLDDELYYTGNPLKPVKQVLDGDKVLTEGKDYEITYNDNVNVSKYSTGNRFTVKGIGEYSGEVEMKFTINSVPYDFCFTIPEEIEYGTKVNPVITKNPENLTTYFYYYKEENGELISLKNAPTEIGSYVVEGRNGIGNGYLQTRIRPYKLGDVDENGEITVSDAIMVLQHVAKNNILTGNQLLAADVEKVKGAETTSSSITVSDAIKILQYVAKNISSFD